jgi:hypothetical protein
MATVSTTVFIVGKNAVTENTEITSSRRRLGHDQGTGPVPAGQFHRVDRGLRGRLLRHADRPEWQQQQRPIGRAGHARPGEGVRCTVVGP